MKRSGGRNVYGWRISEIPEVCLDAQFHSVWETPERKPVDVTPEEFWQQRILFVADPHRTYSGTRFPLERCALGDQSLVDLFWLLSDQCSQIFGDLLAAGIGCGGPVYRIRLDLQRFESMRDVAPYLGLVPKRDQSGETDKQLGISKAGDAYLRRLPSRRKATLKACTDSGKLPTKFSVVPNRLTASTLSKADRGEEVERFASADDLFASWDS